MVTERPFFVVGCPRSGTTLLRFMLASHSRLWIPDETGFLPFLGVPPDRPLEGRELRRAALRAAALNRDWRDAVERVLEVERGSTATLGELVDGLYRFRMEGSGARRWGDKTPLYVLHLPALAAIFPEAQFLHVIRDGRDVAVSISRTWGRTLAGRLYLDEICALERWAEAVGRGRSAGAALGPERYLEVRYEALVERSASCLGGVCSFLGEDLEPAMLEPERLARELGASGVHAEVRSSVSTARVGRWRRELSPFGRVAAERIAGPLLSELGYGLDPAAGGSSLDQVRLVVARSRCLAVRGLRAVLERVTGPRLNRAKRARRLGRG